ncbi:MAG TPA: hypothetical protein VMY98_06990 [Anaerolineae bacterium]|nr:hypothetical protein [Anaerolineae bacterium]
MNARHRWTLVILIMCAASLGSVTVACTRAPSFDDRLSEITKAQRFSIARWEIAQVLNGGQAEGKIEPQDPYEHVSEFFALTEEIRLLQGEIYAISTGDRPGDLQARERELQRLQQRKGALRDGVEWVLGRQVREALNQQSLYNPADRYVHLRVAFPPISFTLEPPPHALIVSPRDRIESIREIMLVQHIDRETMESIETQVDALGVSSLVVDLGGFGGTYPAFVADDASLRYTIGTATEEWFHHYLFFTPLGFRYLLNAIGISRNYEIATMNETLAGIVREEIADIVMETHYPPHGVPTIAPASAEPQFDFSREMRQLRLAVDKLLVEGQIEEAETLMEERRQYLASKGYYIRKLNQAYFAFHGTYADEPTSVDPIGVEMREARRQSASLSNFVNVLSVMTSRQDLIDHLEEKTSY